jgi:hypothetical protein
MIQDAHRTSTGFVVLYILLHHLHAGQTQLVIMHFIRPNYTSTLWYISLSCILLMRGCTHAIIGHRSCWVGNHYHTTKHLPLVAKTNNPGGWWYLRHCATYANGSSVVLGDQTGDDSSEGST